MHKKQARSSEFGDFSGLARENHQNREDGEGCGQVRAGRSGNAQASSNRRDMERATLERTRSVYWNAMKPGRVSFQDAKKPARFGERVSFAESGDFSGLDGTLKSELTQRAKALGFARVAVAHAQPLDEEAERLNAWLDKGFHGSMDYMERTLEQRVDPCSPGVAPFAKSVLVFAMPYGRGQQHVGPTPGRVARYAWGRDYHNVIGKKLLKLVRWLEDRGFRARPAVDTKPVFERAWAVRAGLGFIGKNSCLIVPGIGSHVLLGVILSDAWLEPDEPIGEGCGNCTLCLTSCPTNAFAGPRQLDARRCVSYLTIESRKAAPPALRAKIGNWIFGCDACQDPCPYNQGKGARVGNEAFDSTERWGTFDAEGILEMGELDFARWAEGSPLRRAGRDGMARNAAVILANTKSKRALPVLQRVAVNHSSAMVRETAAWAVQVLHGDDP